MGPGRPHKCPYCDATKSVSKGFRYNKVGKVRLRRCKACGRRWTAGPPPAVQAPIPTETVGETLVAAQHGTEPRTDDQPKQLSQGIWPKNDTQEVEDDEQAERSTELSLSGEGSPSQDDSGKEENEESEETLFAQREIRCVVPPSVGTS